MGSLWPQCMSEVMRGTFIYFLLKKQTIKTANFPPCNKQTNKTPKLNALICTLFDLCLGKSLGTVCLVNMSISLQCLRNCDEAVASMEMMWAVISVNINRIKKELFWLETELPWQFKCFQALVAVGATLTSSAQFCLLCCQCCHQWKDFWGAEICPVAHEFPSQVCKLKSECWVQSGVRESVLKLSNTTADLFLLLLERNAS